MTLAKCPVCSSESNNLSKTWPEPDSLTKLPLQEWKVTWFAKKPVRENCCVVCATVISVLFAARTFNGLTYDMYFHTQLKARKIPTSQRYVLALDHVSNFFDDGIFRDANLIIIDPLGSSPSGLYEPCCKPPINSGSPESLELSKRWLDTCRAKHPDCAAQVGHYIPTRLLFINQDDLRLVLREEVGASQDETKYVALSHCWGGSQPLKTLKSNVSLHRAGIPVEELPTTFKDAIQIVRGLGLQYIWIDSLCIVQDDNDDWVREAEQMGRVYGDAELVLAAAAASTANEGFLRDRPSEKGGSIGFKLDKVNAALRLDDESDGGGVLDLNDEIYPDDGSGIAVESDLIRCDYRIVNRHSEDSPLDLRAWAYQERLLAKRYLKFGLNEMRWECLKDSYCECGWIFVGQRETREIMNLEKLLESPPISGELELWHGIVRRYSERGLTVRSDKLVALSSVASRFQSKYGGTYLAGLWKEHLVLDLLWFYEVKFSSPKNPTSPESFYGPTWSWASINIDQIAFCDYILSKSFTPLVDIMSASVTPSTANRFGPVSSGSIQLRGKTIQSIVSIEANGDLKSWIDFGEFGMKMVNLILDLPLVAYGPTINLLWRETAASARRINFAEKDNPQEAPAMYLIWFLPMLVFETNLIVLVLGPSPTQPGCFERLGFGYSEDLQDFADLVASYLSVEYETQDITLV
ncbi:HET-domain-containing protein [Annulohypoxylon moriforme]|nr:HET-domain-containing protein [Annulohypoxylon moriforme]